MTNNVRQFIDQGAAIIEHLQDTIRAQLAEIERRGGGLERLERERDQAVANLDRTNKSFATARGDLDTFAVALGSMRKKCKRLSYERDTQIREVGRLQGEVAQLERKHGRLRREHEEMKDRVDEMTEERDAAREASVQSELRLREALGVINGLCTKFADPAREKKLDRAQVLRGQAAIARAGKPGVSDEDRAEGLRHAKELLGELPAQLEKDLRRLDRS